MDAQPLALGIVNYMSTILFLSDPGAHKGHGMQHQTIADNYLTCGKRENRCAKTCVYNLWRRPAPPPKQ